MSAKISVSIPEQLLPEIDNVARREHRSRSELVREAVRRYLAVGRQLPLVDVEPGEDEATKRGRAEFEQGEFVRLEDLQRELGLPTR